MLVPFAKYNWNDQVKKDDMGRECSTNWGGEECVEDISGNLGEKRPIGR
jgi:hypothetical protein